MKISHLVILSSISIGVLASLEWTLVAISAKSLETFKPSFEPNTRKLLTIVGYAVLGGGHLLDTSVRPQ